MLADEQYQNELAIHQKRTRHPSFSILVVLKTICLSQCNRKKKRKREQQDHSSNAMRMEASESYSPKHHWTGIQEGKWFQFQTLRLLNWFFFGRLTKLKYMDRTGCHEYARFRIGFHGQSKSWKNSKKNTNIFKHSTVQENTWLVFTEFIMFSHVSNVFRCDTEKSKITNKDETQRVLKNNSLDVKDGH